MFNNHRKTPLTPSFKARHNHNRSKSFCPGEFLPFNPTDTTIPKTPKQTSPPPSLQNTVMAPQSHHYYNNYPPATSPKRPSAQYHINTTRPLPFTPFQKRLNQDSVHSPTIPDDDDDDDDDSMIEESEASNSNSQYSSFIHDNSNNINNNNNNNNSSINSLNSVGDKENCLAQPTFLRSIKTPHSSAMSITPPPQMPQSSSQSSSSSSSLSLLTISDDLGMENVETDVEMNDPENKDTNHKHSTTRIFKKPSPIDISNSTNDNNNDTDDDIATDDDVDVEGNDDDNDEGNLNNNNDATNIINSDSNNNNSQLVRSETVPLFSATIDTNISNPRSTTSLTPEPQLSASLAPLDLEGPNEFNRLPHAIIDKGCFTNPSVVADVITNFDKYRDRYDKYIIIDCRYWYEYNGGHINGAIQLIHKDDFDINSSDKEKTQTFKNQIKKLFFNESQLRSREECKKTLIFFHCEFSQKRGPEIYEIFRYVDREIHQSEWPFLLYPEMYIIRGGYTAFFTHYSHLCTTNVHIKMNDPKYGCEMIRCNTHYNRVVSKRSDDHKRSASTSRLPDGNNNNNGSISNGDRRCAHRPNVRMGRLFEDEGDCEKISGGCEKISGGEKVSEGCEKVNDYENVDSEKSFLMSSCSEGMMNLVTPSFGRRKKLCFNKIDFNNNNNKSKKESNNNNNNDDGDDDDDDDGDFFLRPRPLFD